MNYIRLNNTRYLNYFNLKYFKIICLYFVFLNCSWVGGGVVARNCFNHDLLTVEALPTPTYQHIRLFQTGY